MECKNSLTQAIFLLQHFSQTHSECYVYKLTRVDRCFQYNFIIKIINIINKHNVTRWPFSEKKKDLFLATRTICKERISGIGTCITCNILEHRWPTIFHQKNNFHWPNMNIIPRLDIQIDRKERECVNCLTEFQFSSKLLHCNSISFDQTFFQYYLEQTTGFDISLKEEIS